MLKTTESIGFAKESKKIKTRVDSDNIVDDNKVTNQINNIKRKNQAKITKSKILIKFKNHDFLLNSRNIKAGPGFFIFKARLTFIKLR